MTTLYTAVGRFERRSDCSGNRHPAVIVSGKEHIVGIHEMLLWTCLCWRFLEFPGLASLYEQKSREAGIRPETEPKRILDRLLRSGIAASGAGDTGGDALHDLLSDLYVVPAVGKPIAKIAAFLSLTLFDGVAFRKASRIFHHERLSGNEKQILSLAKQTRLSTSEIIKCVEAGICDVSTDEKVLDALYCDGMTTSDNIGCYARLLKTWSSALSAVANLYLKQIILLERV